MHDGESDVVVLASAEQRALAATAALYCRWPLTACQRQRPCGGRRQTVVAEQVRRLRQLAFVAHAKVRRHVGGLRQRTASRRVTLDPWLNSAGVYRS